MKNKSPSLTTLLLFINGVLFSFSWITIIFKIPQFENWSVGAFTSTILLFGYLVHKLYSLSKENMEFKARQPKLKFKTASVKEYNVTSFSKLDVGTSNFFAGTAASSDVYFPAVRIRYGSTDNVLTTRDTYEFIQITYINEKPENQITETALNVSAKMDFYNEEGHQLLEEGIPARWTDNPEPSFYFHQPIPISQQREIDIPANATRSLVIITKQYQDRYCYVYNTDTYNQNDIKRPAAQLPCGCIYLRLAITGSNVNVITDWYQIESQGEQSNLFIKKCNNPF